MLDVVDRVLYGSFDFSRIAEDRCGRAYAFLLDLLDGLCRFVLFQDALVFSIYFFELADVFLRGYGSSSLNRRFVNSGRIGL